MKMKKTSPRDQLQNNSNNPINETGNYVRRSEPKDSNPKIHIISNAGNMLNIRNQNSNNYKNLNKITISELNKYIARPHIKFIPCTYPTSVLYLLYADNTLYNFL